MNIRELLEMPYDQRRIIVVTQTPVGTDDTQAVEPDKNPTRPWLIAAAVASSVVIPGAGMAMLLVNARRLMRRSGENLVTVSFDDAAQLRFPLGHPRRNVVYVAHPVDPPVYIPVADFHRFLFEHKVAEALRLIRSLGAVTVEVVRVEGWDRTAGIGLGAAGQFGVGAAASQERGSGYSVLSTMRLNPTLSPSVPADLVWLPHEPLWQEVAQARLEAGLDSFVVDVRSTDDYGVNAGLKALVANAGLEVGGSFVEHRNTVWRLQGTFS